MMDKLIIRVNPEIVEEEPWNDFILSHPNGNIFQTHFFYRIFRNTKDFTPNLIVAKSEALIVGIWLSVIQKVEGRLAGHFSARSITYGGPVIYKNDIEILEEMVKAYLNTVEKFAIYSQIRNIYDVSSFRDIFEKSGMIYEKHLDIHIDLKRDPEEIISRVSKNKRRNVTKSENKGVTFYELSDRNEILNSIKLIRETYRRINLPVPDHSFFISVLNEFHPAGILKIFGTKLNNKLIGVRFELCYKGVIYDWYAGSDEDHKNKYPNDVLPFRIIKWGIENNYSLFDFGGAGHPDKQYGVRDHKEKFGGETVEFGRFEMIHKPTIYRISHTGFKIWQRIKR